MEQANVFKKRNQIDGLRTTGDAGFLFFFLLVLGFLLWGPHSPTHSFGSSVFSFFFVVVFLSSRRRAFAQTRWPSETTFGSEKRDTK